jgi:hypothetical protein
MVPFSKSFPQRAHVRNVRLFMILRTIVADVWVGKLWLKENCQLRILVVVSFHWIPKGWMLLYADLTLFTEFREHNSPIMSLGSMTQQVINPRWIWYRFKC